jgi:hypothetical protein
MSTLDRARTCVRRSWPDAAVVAAIVAVVVLPVWPGVFTIDSIVMYANAQNGHISNWYAPVLQSIWAVFIHAGAPIGLALTVAVTGLVVAVMCCLRLSLSRTASWPATAALVIWPPIYGLAGWVGRDVWFAALLLGTVAALGWAIRVPERRWPLLGVAFVTAWFAADARQNGFPALFVVGAVAGWAWSTRSSVRTLERTQWLQIIAAGLCAVLIGFMSASAVRAFVVERPIAPEEALYYQDLLAMSLEVDEMLVPDRFLRSDDLDVIRRRWIDGQSGAVLYVPGGPVRYDPGEPGGAALRNAWLRAIVHHPFAYAAVRSELTLQILGARDGTLSAWFDRSDLLAPWTRQFAPDLPRLASVRADYLDAFDASQRGAPGPLHAAWMYLLAGLLGGALLVAAGGWQRVFGWAVLALQLLLQAVLFFAAPVAEYRFEYFQIVLGIVVAILGAHGWWQSRHVAAPVDPEGVASVAG